MMAILVQIGLKKVVTRKKIS
ncbi:hypothetical protein Godav_021028 [Gossypium davidsonii]|uniref:Uncharacterized protein n=1 Tax=Gossypium davidsonii TaxID=34287 RepID=A0A7J8R4V1_GOSDV|nr:hypothetical protein [Gossypium davidsonii]